MTPATMSGMACPSSMPGARGLRSAYRSVRRDSVPWAIDPGSGALRVADHTVGGDQRAQAFEGPLHVPACLARPDVPEFQQDTLVIGGDVPALFDQGSPVDRGELVAPGPTGHDLAHESLGTGLPGEASVLLELDDPVHRRVRDE